MALCVLADGFQAGRCWWATFLGIIFWWKGYLVTGSTDTGMSQSGLIITTTRKCLCCTSSLFARLIFKQEPYNQRKACRLKPMFVFSVLNPHLFCYCCICETVVPQTMAFRLKSLHTSWISFSCVSSVCVHVYIGASACSVSWKLKTVYNLATLQQISCSLT